MKPRGIRNNNPGNIRHGEQWEGLSEVQSDRSFCVFKSPEYGIRAIAKIMISYKRQKYNTPEKIIYRWAPPCENDTDSYTLSVCQAIGAEPDQIIDVCQKDVMLKLIKSIIHHENGIQPYSDETILKSIEMAGVK